MLPDHEARAIATKPENGRGDLICAAEPANWLISQNLLHGLRLLGEHFRHHRRLDCARTNRIDPNSSGGVFKSRTFRQPDDSMFGGVVDRAAGDADEPTDGGVVDDGTAALRAHLEQLILHAVPHTTEIDRIDP